MNATSSKIEITVSYWVGTRKCKGKATTYAGAMRIASRNQNAYGHKFYDADGRQLHDLGNCLAYEPNDKGEIVAYA